MAQRWITLYFFISSAPLFAESGLTMLDRMAESMRSSNYTGTFVYRHKDKVETLKIIHRSTEDGVKERLVTLSGKPREIIRDNEKVKCIWPERRLVLLDNKPSKSHFPGIIPQNLERLESYYTINVSDSAERVAGRAASVVDISPRDEFRYGYRLWIDQEANLLVRSDLLDDRGSAVEQVMFTELQLHDALPDEAFESKYLQEDFIRKKVGQNAPKQSAQQGQWSAAKLPPGFALQSYRRKVKESEELPIEHIIYSDGMASVSVFIKQQKKPYREQNRRTKRGALHVFRKPLDGYHVTVLGEVPSPTVKLIAESITISQ